MTNTRDKLREKIPKICCDMAFKYGWDACEKEHRNENELLKRKLEVAREGLIQIQSCGSRDEAFYKALRTLAEIDGMLK